MALADLPMGIPFLDTSPDLRCTYGNQNEGESHVLGAVSEMSGVRTPTEANGITQLLHANLQLLQQLRASMGARRSSNGNTT